MEVDEEEIRNKKYFPFKIGTWLFLLIFLVLMIDFLFFKRSILPDVKDPIKIYLIMGMLSYDCYFYHGFQTAYLGKLSHLSLMEKVKIIGFNVVCLGWIFDIFR